MHPGRPLLERQPGLADLLGYATAEDLVRAVDSLPERTFHDPSEWHDIPDTMKTRGTFVTRLVKRHKKDGTPIWVLMNMRAVRAPDGSLSHFEGFTLDITERLLAARALAENEERLRTLINAMPDIVYFKDGQGRWLEANTFTQRLFELGPADYLQRTDRELAGLRPNFRGTFIESAISDDLAWHSARMYRGEQAILDRDNTPRMFDLIKVPLFRDDGSRRGIVTVGRDITKQRETSAALAKFNRKLESLVTERTAELEEKAAELEQANARLLELDALKSSFVSSVSHEVRTPLTSILGFTRLIERDFQKHYLPLGQDNRTLAAKGNRIMANLRVIDREGDRLKRLINDFLDLAKIEYGSLRWQDSWVGMAELCAQVADAVQGMFSERPELAFALDLERPAAGLDRSGPPPAGAFQPRGQRGEVHPGRQRHTPRLQGIGQQSAPGGQRHRHRHRSPGPRTDFRKIPPGPAKSGHGGPAPGHRARTHHLPPDRPALRRHHLGRKRTRPRQHLPDLPAPRR